MNKQDGQNRQIEIEAAVENHRIFLMRHGETEWNRNFRYQGCSDVPLSEVGESQARRLAVRMSRIAPTRVFASPLSRAYRTAEILMEGNRSDVAIEPCEELREVSFGFWEGKTVDEVRALDGGTLDRWRSVPFSATPRDGESMASIMARSDRMADRVRSEGRAGDVTFVVAHGAILRSFLGSLMRIDDLNVLWRMRMDNCSVTVLDLWGSRPSLLALNDTHHLHVADDEIVASLDFCR
ncbi:histidine phosphatase family protein [Synergistaceae bacterium OttesenSCG-928-I11]|nr:histidine phosphatase family protein [Synergistaceae bacterium OttesenSCG-928-I11]